MTDLIITLEGDITLIRAMIQGLDLNFANAFIRPHAKGIKIAAVRIAEQPES